MNIAVCDDNASERESIITQVYDWGRETSAPSAVFDFPSAESFLFEFEENKNFDVLLLDIEMGAMNGVDLAKKLREQKSRIEIIFVTTHREFYGEGYEVDALHYLIKPVSKEKLFSVLNKAAEKITAAPLPIVITSEGETLRIDRSSVLYAEAYLHYIVLHTKSGEYKIKESFGVFETKLGPGFFRCHRSYIVSLREVSRISRSSVTLSNGKELPLSRGKYDDINRAYILAYS